MVKKKEMMNGYIEIEPLKDGILGNSDRVEFLVVLGADGMIKENDVVIVDPQMVIKIVNEGLNKFFVKEEYVLQRIIFTPENY